MHSKHLSHQTLVNTGTNIPSSVGPPRTVVRAKQKLEWERLVQSIGEDSSKNPKRMWSNIKRIIGSGKTSTGATSVRKADGSLAFSEVDRREAWADYLSKLGQPLQEPNFDSQFAISMKWNRNGCRKVCWMQILQTTS